MELNNLICENLSCNTIKIGINVSISGSIVGEGNEVIIDDSKSKTELKVEINGNNNKIRIIKPTQIHKLHIRCGSHYPADSTTLTIGKGTTIGTNNAFYLFNSTNSIKIGADCMLSKNIKIRCGEAPHLIFDKNTGEYLDISDGVSIGNHVWIGEGVLITKSGAVGDGSIIGSNSVLSRNFINDENVVIVGNPGSIVKRDIIWFRGPNRLEEGSLYYKSYFDRLNKIAAKKKS